jgi:hypothetical protein
MASLVDGGNAVIEAGIPQLRAPESMPGVVVAVVAMVVLAGLDIAGALLARRWATGGSTLWFLAGALCFVVLFWVYGSSLRYADLVCVTFGWIAALQVGLLIAGQVASSAAVPLRTWVIAGVIIALEGVLLASSNPG